MNAECLTLVTELPTDAATAAAWVQRWLNTHSLNPGLLTVSSLLKQHEGLTLSACALILTTLLETRDLQLLTEADVRANMVSRERDTRYTLLIHTIIHRAAEVLERAHALRSHLINGMGEVGSMLCMLTSSVVQDSGVLDGDVGLPSSGLFMIVCTQAWTHLEYNTSSEFWASTGQITMAAIDRTLREINSDGNLGPAIANFPIAQIVRMLASRSDDTPGTAAAMQVCMRASTTALANYAWRFGRDDVRQAMGTVLLGRIPIDRYRHRPVRDTLLSGFECVQANWVEAFKFARAVEDVAMFLLMDATGPGDSLRMIRCAVRLLGLTGLHHPDRAVFEPVFWTLTDLLEALPRVERESVTGACSRGNHAFLREMLPHCSPEQQRWWRQLCSYPSGELLPPSAAQAVDTLTDMPCTRLYRFHDHCNSLPVSLETIGRHLLTTDPALDPYTRTPVSWTTVVPFVKKN
jgi:hypothetical protein